MPELRQLRYFVAVAEELNFTRAASRLHIAQQALSATIRRLEAELGTPLFTRTTRKVELTTAGEALIEPARRALAETEAAVEVVRAVVRGERGHLHVGLVSGVPGDLPHLVFGAFRERLAHAELDFHYYTWRDPSAGLRSGETHVAFVLPPITAELELLPLSSEPRVAVLRADHPLAGEPELSIGDLVDEVWCDLPDADPAWRDFWLATAHQSDSRPETGPLMTTFDEQVQYALAGAGVSLTAQSVAEHSSRQGLAFVAVRDIEPARLALAWRRGDDSPLVARFVALAAEVRDREAAAGRLRGAKVAPPQPPTTARQA